MIIDKRTEYQKFREYLEQVVVSTEIEHLKEGVFCKKSQFVKLIQMKVYDKYPEESKEINHNTISYIIDKYKEFIKQESIKS